MAALVGDSRDFCMGNHTKIFEWPYLSQKMKISSSDPQVWLKDIIRRNTFRLIFKIMLDTTSFNHLITIPVGQSMISSSLVELQRLKKFCAMVAHAKIMRVPLLRWSFFVCDVISHQAHLNLYRLVMMLTLCG